MFYIGDRLEGIPSGKTSIDETRHSAILGGSGSGKSTLLSRLAIHEIRAGNSLVIIDPHGTLINSVLPFVPKERLRDVVIFDPLAEKPIGLQPLEPQNELSADIAIQILAEQYGANSFMGRSRMIGRNFLYAAVDVLEKPTLFHLWLMFMFNEYAKWILGRSKSQTISRWATKYFEDTPERQREEAAAAPMNKADALMALQALRHVYAQPDGLDFFEAIQSKKLLFCILRKGELGEEAANLLGSNILRLTLSAVLKRNPEEPNPFLSVIVDEFHNFTKGTSPEAFFAETRKYGAAFTVADQSIRQLPDGSADYLLPNVSNLICFRVSAKDAEELGPEIGVNPDALRRLTTGEFYMKNVTPDLVREGVHCQLPVRFASNDRKKKHPLYLPAKRGNEATKGDCYSYSEHHYGRTREEVDRIIDRELQAAYAAERRAE
jgi:hypothetical protein